MKKSLGVLISLFLVGSAIADGIQLGNPAYNGTGCPLGSAAVTLSPDQKSLSILFDQFVAEAGMSTGKSMERKNCNIAVPVHVPQGYSVSIFQVDYRGYTFVPRGATARFDVEYFFAGQKGPKYTRNFSGPLDSDYFIEHGLLTENLVWSACGADVNLRVNSSLMARTNLSWEDIMATVDSADVQAGLIYHIRWRKCSL
jgi:hypothetical protein